MLLPEIGEEGQRRLANASVLVVGLGGLGCPVCLYLTGAGVGRMGLCDSDTVSLTNLHRQLLYDEHSLGEPKAEAARDRLSAISSHTRFDLISEGLNDANADALIAQYDLVIDCTDNHAARHLIDAACLRQGKTWVHGAIGNFTGRVATFTPASPRYPEIFPDTSTMPKAAGGVFTPLPGLIGTLQASEAMKLICGFGDTLAGRMLLAELSTLTFNIIDL